MYCEVNWQCTTCKGWFVENRFYKDKRQKSGLKSQCKKCHSKTNIQTRDKINSRRINREYMRRARKANLEKFRTRDRLRPRLAENSPARQAYRKLHTALKKGIIKKPMRCESCNRKHKLTAHHEDYNKPLDVIWACYECHGQIHWKDLGMGLYISKIKESEVTDV